MRFYQIVGCGSYLYTIADKKQITYLESLLSVGRTCIANKTVSEACKLVLNQGYFWFTQSLAFDFTSFSTIPSPRLVFCFAWSPTSVTLTCSVIPTFPTLDSCSKAPNTPPTTLNKVCLTMFMGRTSVCETRFMLGSAPQTPACLNVKSNPLVPVPLLRPELPPSASRGWKRRLQM